VKAFFLQIKPISRLDAITNTRQHSRVRRGERRANLDFAALRFRVFAVESNSNLGNNILDESGGSGEVSTGVTFQVDDEPEIRVVD
jgi:hypothetical protein